MGETVADAPSAYYQFERFVLDSEDGQRHYRVYLGIPRKAAPAQGYPALYMLDGNAAMNTLTEADLATLYAGNPPVLVGIGYDVPSRHDVVARAYDYTPPILNADGSIQTEVLERGRKGGGADTFLDLIAHRIRPVVAAKAPVDPTRQTLWGHSYGGLFTLYTLVSRPGMFQRYVAGDPSISWGDGAMLKRADLFHAAQAPNAQVRVYVGAGRRPVGATNAQTPEAPVKGPVSAPPIGQQTTHAWVQRMAQEGMDIAFAAYPEQTHGQLLATSLRPALALAAAP